MDEVKLLPSCPPHDWAHAPTVGYFHCGRCGERVNYDDPRYEAMLADYNALLATRPTLVTDELVERVARAISTAANDEISSVTCEIYARASLAAMPTLVTGQLEEGWQPIETAPKDGTRILAYQDGDYYAAAWDQAFPEDSYWNCFCGQFVTVTPEPTHWRPLPAHPQPGPS